MSFDLNEMCIGHENTCLLKKRYQSQEHLNKEQRLYSSYFTWDEGMERDVRKENGEAKNLVLQQKPPPPLNVYAPAC